MAENENLHVINDADFDEQILKASVPALVDFWAAWCGPCRAVGPVVEELATEYAGKVKVAKLNVDDNKETPARYGVRGIPTLDTLQRRSGGGSNSGSGSQRQNQGIARQGVVGCTPISSFSARARQDLRLAFMPRGPVFDS